MVNKKKDPESYARYYRERRIAKKIRAVDYKGGKCIKCGYDKCYDALEFHHRNMDEKEFSPSKLVRNNKWETVKKELDKCDLLCSNCHKEIHHIELGDFQWEHNWKEEVPKNIKICEQCGIEFSPKYSKQKYHNRECSDKAKIKKIQPPLNEVVNNISQFGYSKTARIYNVSRTTVKRWEKMAH